MNAKKEGTPATVGVPGTEDYNYNCENIRGTKGISKTAT